jgi:hypothetical protein
VRGDLVAQTANLRSAVFFFICGDDRGPQPRRTALPAYGDPADVGSELCNEAIVPIDGQNVAVAGADARLVASAIPRTAFTILQS